jgi:hypothetical protein
MPLLSFDGAWHPKSIPHYTLTRKVNTDILDKQN